MTELVRDRTFAPFFAGHLVASCGIWVQTIAAALLMFELTRSIFMVGVVSVVQFAGPLLLAVWAGGIADRRDRKQVLMAGQMLAGTAVASLAVLLAIRGEDGLGGPAPLLVAVLVTGVGTGLSSPSMQALVPALVPDEDLEQALGLSAAAPSTARAVGPAIGAALLVLGGPALAFAVAALTHWAFAAALLKVHPRTSHVAQRAALFAGLRHLVTDRTAGLLVLGVGALGLCADPVVTLTPSLANQLGGGRELTGVLASSFGIGAVLLTGLVRPLRKFLSLRILGVVGFCVLAAGLCTVATATIAPVAAAGFLVAGAGFMTATIALTTRIQRRIPDELRGRVMALWGVAFLGSRPLGALVNGSIGDLVSIQAAFVATAGLAVLACLLARRRFPTVPGRV